MRLGHEGVRCWMRIDTREKGIRIDELGVDKKRIEVEGWNGVSLDRSMHLGNWRFWILVLLMGGVFRVRSISFFPGGHVCSSDVNKTRDGWKSNIFSRGMWVL